MASSREFLLETLDDQLNRIILTDTRALAWN